MNVEDLKLCCHIAHLTKAYNGGLTEGDKEDIEDLELDTETFSEDITQEASTGTGSNAGDSSTQSARFMGYTGDSCSECGHFTLVRNGTCLKCDTCGATSGCS